MAALENDNGNANEMQWRQKQLQLSTDFRFLVALPRESPLSAHRIHALMDAGLDLSSINMGMYNFSELVCPLVVLITTMQSKGRMKMACVLSVQGSSTRTSVLSIMVLESGMWSL